MSIPHFLPYQINVKQSPRARFNMSPTTLGLHTIECELYQYTANMQGATFNWNFGNGTSATTANPSTVYSDSGTYAFTLTVTNSNGCSDDSTQLFVCQSFANSNSCYNRYCRLCTIHKLHLQTAHSMLLHINGILVMVVHQRFCNTNTYV